MSFQESLVSVCAPIFSGRFHDHIAISPVATPYAVYQEISSLPENTLSDGVAIEQSIVQIDVYAPTYAGADAAGKAMESALEAAFQVGTMSGVKRSRRSLFDPTTKFRRILYEYSFWHH